MTKKDYEAIAGAVHRTVMVTSWLERNKIKKEARLSALKLLTNDLIGTLGHDNPKFDENKFRIACGF